ncbi:MAG TPA: PBP1A family penicillin-binding protein, partial [Acidobacteriaceae bacterium]|nr:PBP1A family penicillin-binding protein [Acidobacteriaceae bacterium]
ASALMGVMVALVLVYSVAIPEMGELERYRPDTTTDLYDVHGKIFGSFALERRVVMPYSEFPPILRQAIFSIEDKNFETNGGVNLVRVVGAAYRDLHSDRRSQGASTLTMQLARNLFLSPEKTYSRKLQEILLTLEIERHFTKQQIFTLYANQIYLGSGTYGFEAGSEYYFSKHARNLTLPEAALLAALPKGPEEYSPVRHPDRALRRRNLVLQEMLQDGKISARDAAIAEAAPLGLHLQAPANTEAPYFVEEVRRQLEREYGVDEVHGAGLRVYTTLDLDLQRAAIKAVLDGVATYERRHGWKGHLQNVLTTGSDLDSYRHPDWTQPIREGSYFHALVTEISPSRMTVAIGPQHAIMTYPDWAWTTETKATALAKVGDIVYVRVTSASPSEPIHVVLEQDSGAQASMMALDNANGEVVALVGGRDFALSQFNRATQSQRQVGSSFKPYVYTAAMEAGMTPYSTVLDAPATFYTPGGPYTPHNYEPNYRGVMTLIDAFAESRNIPALRLADKVGIKRVIEVAHRFGVTSNIPVFLPIAIGAADLTLAEQVSSYSVFPNDGIRITPHYIRRVVTPDGSPVQEKAPEVREVISVKIAREMMQLLEAVTRVGTGAQASTLKHAFGGKTGTTNNFTDAWFIGFSPSITCGTWIGFDDPSHSLGKKETGAKAALPMWMDFMKVAVADRPNEEFSRPNEPKKKLQVQENAEAASRPSGTQAKDTDEAPASQAAPAKHDTEGSPVTVAPPDNEAMPEDDGEQKPAIIIRRPPAANVPLTPDAAGTSSPTQPQTQ